MLSCCLCNNMNFYTGRACATVKVHVHCQLFCNLIVKNMLHGISQDVVVNHILIFLPLHDLATFFRLNSQWNKFLRFHPFFWRQICIRHHLFSADDYPSLDSILHFNLSSFLEYLHVFSMSIFFK